MLVNMNDMLTHAYQNGYGIGAFELIQSGFSQGYFGWCCTLSSAGYFKPT
jgi:fructose/tagatose bisphosphate aldolase